MKRYQISMLAKTEFPDRTDEDTVIDSETTEDELASEIKGKIESILSRGHLKELSIAVSEYKRFNLATETTHGGE